MTLYVNPSYEGENEGEIQRINKRKNRNVLHDVRRYFREYSNATGIHGLRYVTEKRSTTEKCVWLVIMVLSVAACVYMINEIYTKYVNTPTVVTFGKVELSISEIPFPAVTICPESKSDKSIFDFGKMLMRIAANESVNVKDRRTYLYVSLLCDSLEESDEIRPNQTFSDQFYDDIEMVSTDQSEVLVFCTWLGNYYNCTDLFVPIFTDEGLCYSFNILDKTEMFKGDVIPYSKYYRIGAKSMWNIESGYSPTAGIETFPKRALLSGLEDGLTVVLMAVKKNVDYICKQSLQGFRVMLHNPLDIPRLSKHYFRVPFGQSVIGAVSPRLITTSEEVKSYSPQKRECFFASERQLKYSKTYTQSNCQLECLSEFVRKACGCINFFMPRDNRTSICGSAKLDCVKKAEKRLKIEQIQNKLSNSVDIGCDCKPLCTDLRYNVQTSQSQYDFEQLSSMMGNLSFLKGVSEIHLSTLSVYFKTDQFLNYERSELYGISDLISNFGGLLGLFTGFSMISLVEIIYFLSMRIYYNNRLFGNWAGPEE